MPAKRKVLDVPLPRGIEPVGVAVRISITSPMILSRLSILDMKTRLMSDLHGSIDRAQRHAGPADHPQEQSCQAITVARRMSRPGNMHAP